MVRTTGPREGYNLVVLMVLVTIMNVLIAIALPLWSSVIKRQKEQELVFRGLQYAEAIRVFQVRTGRYPTSLRELLENEPRTIRQLWTDPLSNDGKWGLILAGQPGTQLADESGRTQSASGAQNPRRDRDEEELDAEPPIPVEDVTEEGRFGAPEGVQASGPIVGVRSLSDDETTLTFNGQNVAGEWQFTAELIPILPEGAVAENIPRLTSRYIGRSFPQGLEPEGGNLPGSPSAAGNPTAGDAGGQSRQGDKPRRRPQGDGRADG